MKLMFACYILLVHFNAFYFYKHSYIFKLVKLLIRGIGQGRQQLFVEIIFFCGTAYGCWIIAPALPPLSPHYGVMARPVGAHPNGMSSKPQQTLAWGFSHVQGNNHYGNIKFRGRWLRVPTLTWRYLHGRFVPFGVMLCCVALCAWLLDIG
jgi:hypothetical protein